MVSDPGGSIDGPTLELAVELNRGLGRTFVLSPSVAMAHGSVCSANRCEGDIGVALPCCKELQIDSANPGGSLLRGHGIPGSLKSCVPLGLGIG